MSRTNAEEALKAQLARLPAEPGVYLFKDATGRILYVGKAKELRTRVRSYFREGGDGRYHIRFLIKRIAGLDFIVTDTEQEALILENNLIKKHRPRYNIFLRDDKTYVHVRLNADHPFPRLTIVRKPRRDKARYFGPYASAGSVRSTLRMLGRVFPMRTCTDAELTNRKRPCLYHYIKRCPAPCVGLIDSQSYADAVGKVSMFLKGRGEQLVKALTDRMEFESAERRYEAASRTRDQLLAMRRTLEKQRISSPTEAQRDVFGVYRDKHKMVIQLLRVRDGEMTGGETFFFDNAALTTAEHLGSFLNQFYQSGVAIPAQIVLSDEIREMAAMERYLSERREGAVHIRQPKRGELKKVVELAVKNAVLALEERGAVSRNKEMLEELQDLLDLQSVPRRIECFDISNFQGRDAVASGVVYIDGEPAKSLYRHYKVRTVRGADDYAMMREVLERRLARGEKEGDLPDLVVVDGGRGQLGVARKVLARLGLDGLDVLGIAKVRSGKHRRRVRGKERIYAPHLPEALLLEGNSEALYLLQRIRDEAHRFAITHHKRLRSKGLEASVLDSVPGIGPVLKRRLLSVFGGLDAVRRAGVAELASVQGVSRTLAARLKEILDLRP